jgi:hypothetical protein
MYDLDQSSRECSHVSDCSLATHHSINCSLPIFRSRRRHHHHHPPAKFWVFFCAYDIPLEADFKRINEHGIAKIISSRRSFVCTRWVQGFVLFCFFSLRYSYWRDMNTSVQCFGIIKQKRKGEEERKENMCSLNGQRRRTQRERERERETNRPREYDDCPFYLTPCALGSRKKISAATAIHFHACTMHFHVFSRFTCGFRCSNRKLYCTNKWQMYINLLRG